MTKISETCANLLKEFPSLKDKWSCPFPIGTFGTLKLGCGNSYLMGSSADGKIQSVSYRGSSRNHVFRSHYKAFMPHFSPSGLSISFDPGKAGVFEIFVYEPEEWQKMIGNVDSLESFTPGKTYEWGYFRTLAWLHVLPSDYGHKFFDDQKLSHNEKRVLPIPESEWKMYERIPCWVYSSLQENQRACKFCESAQNKGHNPIIWYGEEA